jgi:hypothetical protein
VPPPIGEKVINKSSIYVSSWRKHHWAVELYINTTDLSLIILINDKCNKIQHKHPYVCNEKLQNMPIGFEISVRPYVWRRTAQIVTKTGSGKDLLRFVIFVPNLVYVTSCTCFWRQLECNSLNIYRSKKCLEEQLLREMKHASSPVNSLRKPCGFRDNWTKANEGCKTLSLLANM